MLKKIFYFGLGLISLLSENFDELARAGEQRYNKKTRTEQPPQEESEAHGSPAVKPVNEAADTGTNSIIADDLTAISGIGPTFASRLMEAHITTYQQLAELSVDQVRDITHVADWQADPEDWIVQAKTFA